MIQKVMPIQDAIFLGLKLANDGNIKNAKNILNKIIIDLPEDAKSLHLLGSLAFRLKKYELAADFVSKAIQLDPSNEDFYIDMGSLFNILNKYDEALNMYQKVVSLNPNRIEAHNNIGIIFRLKSEYNKAIESYKYAISIEPNYAAAYNNLGITYIEIGKFNDAIESFKMAASLNPNFSEAYSNLGDVYSKELKWDLALQAYQKSIKISPNSSEIHNSIGVTLKKLNKMKKAEKSLKKAIELNPNYVDAYDNLGNVLLVLKKIDEAISCYNKAIEINPNSLSSYYNLAFALRDTDRTNESIEAFKKVVELDPNNFSAQHLLDALQGNTTEIAPKQYVKSLFDMYSKKFDQHLLEILEYRTPQIILKTIEPFIDNGGQTNALPFQNTLDLGCGTGLSGLIFKDLTERLTGIDISGKMINEAKKKNVYDKIYVTDIIEYLKSTDEKYDCFIASDVFVYFGDMLPVFNSISRIALKGAFFIFSIESAQVEKYILNSTGRYSHSKDYIISLAKEHNFTLKTVHSAELRKQSQKAVIGEIFVFNYEG
ncbi:MAG: tetratricopeptide repeat protein [Desulfobacterales bacterium]|nr:tetratricopeptide repeat protein [Desulfobacterales bacterium]